MTDANRNFVQSYGYDSFGMVKPSTSFVNSYTYTAREWDRETGLYYYRARYYDPMEGRFVSKDPISIRSNIDNNKESISFSQYVDSISNPYTYVQNNPVNEIDPMGLSGAGVGRTPPSPPSQPMCYSCNFSELSNCICHEFNDPSSDMALSKCITSKGEDMEDCREALSALLLAAPVCVKEYCGIQPAINGWCLYGSIRSPL